MATTYTELKDEIQRWLDNDNPNVVAAIPDFITEAETRFNRYLRTWEMECRISTDLVPMGVTEDELGIYDLPADWAGHKVVEVLDDKLWILYYFRIPPLSDANTENWLLTKHPDLYRYTALAAAEGFVKNDPRIALWKQMAGEILSEVHNMDVADKLSGGPIQARDVPGRSWRKTSPTNKRLRFLESADFFELVSSKLTGSMFMNEGFFTVAAQKIRIYPVPEMPTP